MMTFKWREYGLLMRLDKPIGILLLLWPALWALWVAAEGLPNIHVLLVFCAGVFLMRSAGCVINDFADRHVDGHVERTQHRPLAAGRVSSKEALLLFAVLSLLAFALVLTLNRFTILLSIGGVLLAASYPFAKRFHQLPQVHLGIAFAWAIPMAYAAQSNMLAVEAWLLFAITIIWAVIYDTMYAMVDREDDLKIGVKSTAILFGQYDKLIIGILQVVMLALLSLLGWRLQLGIFYWLAIVSSAGLFIYQQWLIRDRVRSLCFQGFLNNNYIGLILFTGILLSYI